MIDIELEFNKSGYDYDKSIDFIDKLPYSIEDTSIQPNELSYHKTFNTKLSYLYDNFMYLYSRCSIPSYNVPTTFNGFIGVTGSDFGIYDDISTMSKPFSSANNGNLDFGKNGIVYKNEKDNIYYLFVNCLTSINVIQHDNNLNLSKTSSNIITTIDPISGELAFKKINSISISENKYLCVSDEILDSVFKYDLDTYFSNDNIFKNASSPFGSKLFLIDIVGGEGGRYDTIKFEKPKNVSSKDDLILIEDSGNKIFKLFNSDFNFLSYQTFISLYNNITSFQSIKFKNEEEIYGIVKNGYYVFDLNPENYKMKLNSFVSLSSSLSAGEYIIDINFCNYEKNIIYILTNKNFIKKWDSKIYKSIGSKKAQDFGGSSNFKWFTTISKNVSSDLIYIYTYNSTSSANQILVYTDELKLISNLSDRNFKVYSKDEILIKKQEWNQSWVYEKSIKKMVKNVETLKNTIAYNFIKKEDYYGNLINLARIYNKEALTCYDRVVYNEQFTLGLNENFQSSVINRLLNRTHILEEDLLMTINGQDSVDRDYILYTGRYNDNLYWKDCETWIDY